MITKRTGSPFTQLVTRRLFTLIGAHKTIVESDGRLQSNVDELYRWELGLESLDHTRDFAPDSTRSMDGSIDMRQFPAHAGWRADSYRGLTRYSAYGNANGRRNAFVRIPDTKAVIILLTDNDAVDARGMADALTDRLFGR